LIEINSTLSAARDSFDERSIIASRHISIAAVRDRPLDLPVPVARDLLLSTFG
jgi:hypothetical protein